MASNLTPEEIQEKIEYLEALLYLKEEEIDNLVTEIEQLKKQQS